MLNTSTSPSISDVAFTTFEWPCTTKPWVVTTVVMGADDVHARVLTICAASGIEMACSLVDPEYTLVSIQCYMIDQGRWRARNVTEIAVGMLGEEAVAVFRDDQGNTFCPDAPDLPTSAVAELILAGCVAGHVHEPRLPPKPTVGRQLHNAFVREYKGAKGAAPSDASASGQPACAAEEANQSASL